MKNIFKLFNKKFISIILAFTLLINTNYQAFAQLMPEQKSFDVGLSSFTEFTTQFSLDNSIPKSDIENSFDETLDNLFLQGGEKDIYAGALEREVQSEIKKIEKSSDIARIKNQTKTGKSKYGILSPSYVKASAINQLGRVEYDLLSFIAINLQEPKVMSLKEFEKYYNEAISQAAEEYAALNPLSETPIPYKNANDLIAEEMKISFPIKESYASYKKEAEAEIAWRNKNKAKVEDAIYRVSRKYIEAIEADNLSYQTISLLANLKMNGKDLITGEERKKIYNYAVTRLEKQDLEKIDLGLFSDKKDAKVAQKLLQDVLETILIGGIVVNNDGARYGKAVESVINRSYEGPGFSHILLGGFSSLLGAGEYASLRRILAHYTQEEEKGPGFWDYFDLGLYTHGVENLEGKYLGKVSKETQYTTEYLYANVFSDIAELLAKDGSVESLRILKEYSLDKGLKNSIKPFYAAALASGKVIASGDKAQKAALELSNMNFGDIEAIQEYDVDRALMGRYPSIKESLGAGAIITKDRLASRETKGKNFDYLHRAAEAGNVFLAVWGTIGLIKLGVGAVSLANSTYTAVQAGRIANSAKRIGYIKTNYAKMGKYISAKNNLARMKWRIKSGGFKIKELVGVAKGTKPQEPAKVTAYFERQQVNKLYNIRKEAVLEVRNSKNPTPRQQARAELATAQYKAKVAQLDYAKQAKGTGAAGIEAKNASYLEKVRAYNTKVEQYNSKLQALTQAEKEGASAEQLAKLRGELNALEKGMTAPQGPVYNASELGYLQSYNRYNKALSNFRTASSNYKATSWWNRNISAPWKKFWTASGQPVTLGIAELETGKGITIAEALKIDRPYNPDYTSGIRLFSSEYKPTRMDKFYTFLQDHKMGGVASTLKFINNKATLFGTTLLLNYNIATITPAMAEGAQGVRTATELVVNTGKLANQVKPISMMGGLRVPAANLPKPVSVIDPKIFAHFNGVPLPGGNIVNNFSLKGLGSSVGNITAMTASAVSMPVLFGKDLYSAFRNAFIYSKPAFQVAPVRNVSAPAILEYSAPVINTQATKVVRRLDDKTLYLFGSEDYAPIPFPFQAKKYFYEVPGVPHLSSVYKSDIHQQYISERDKRAAGQAKIAEEKALSSAWDAVYSNPKGKANKVMAEMQSDGVVFKVLHGHAVIDRNGEIVVQGPVLKRIRGVFSNFGLTKIIYKHSNKAGKNGRKYTGEDHITKGDFLKLPYIIRNYAPITTDKDFPARLTYRIPNENGQDLVVVFSKLSKEDAYSLVTMFYQFRVSDTAPASAKLDGSLRTVLGLPSEGVALDLASPEDAFAVLEEGFTTAEKTYSDLVALSTDMAERSQTMSLIGEDGVEKMLPVQLSINEHFDAKGYSNVVFNKGVAELRENNKTPRVMSNFYIRLRNEKKSLSKLVEALMASKESMTLKVWHLGIEPDNMVTVPLYSPDGTLKLPVTIITDARFVENDSKLVLMPSGRIGALGADSYSPAPLPSSVIIRVPKNQIKVLLPILQSIKAPVPLEIMPSYNKADVITKQGYYINPSLGKTLGPVLPESLGISEADATNLMYFVNYLPGLLSPMLNPLIKKYGEVAMFKASILVSVFAALLPAAFGFYGYASTMEPTLFRSISLGISLFALAFSINIRNVVGNSLINMNRGSMPIAKDKKKEAKNIAEATKITFDILLQKFKKLFQKGTDFSMEDILYYNLSFINKNLGTMAFLIAPSILNYGGKLFGLDLGLGWDVSLPLYAAYSAYAGYKVHKTNLRDKKIIEHIKNDIYQVTPLAAENPGNKEAAAAKMDKKDILKDVKEIFDIMLHKEGVMAIVTGMSLATAHELSVSSAFSSTLYQIIPDGDMATIAVISVLYGSLMIGRLLGNITTTRMSPGSSYLGYSTLSVVGTAAILGGIMLGSPGLTIGGGVVASIGMGNYFSQMYAYIIRKHPELQSQISQALSFTMPVAVLLSLPVTYLNDWTGLPYARVMASLILLALSMVSTKGMLESSTLYKYIAQEFKEASDYVIAKYKNNKDTKAGGTKEEPPTDMNNPLPN